MPQVGQEALVFVGDDDLSAQSNMWDFSVDVALHDVTTFGAQYRRFTPGLMGFTGSFAGFAETDNDDKLFDYNDGGAEWFAMARARESGDRCWVGRVRQATYSQTQPIDGVVEFNGAITAQDERIYLGHVIQHPVTIASATGTSTDHTSSTLDSGIAAGTTAGYSLVVYLTAHTPTATGGVSWELQHRALTSAAWVAASSGTLSTARAIESRVINTTSGQLNRYVRLEATLRSATTSASFAAFFVRK